MLFVWMCFHVIEDSGREFYFWRDDYHPRPLARFELLKVPEQPEWHWKQLFEKLNSARVNWRAPWLKAEKFIIGCGEFHSVPLIGVRGYVSYTPLLVMRQFQYRQDVPLIAAMKRIESIYHGQVDYQIMLQRFIIAWKILIEMNDLDTSIKGGEASVGYLEWVQSRGQPSTTAVSEPQILHTTKQLVDYEYENKIQRQRIEALERELAQAKKEKSEGEEREQQLKQKCQSLESEGRQKRKRHMESNNSLAKENIGLKDELARIHEQAKQLREVIASQKARVAHRERAFQEEKRQKEDLAQALNIQKEAFEQELLNQGRKFQEKLAAKELEAHKEKEKAKDEPIKKCAELESQIQELRDEVNRLKWQLQREYELNEVHLGIVREIEDLWKESYGHLKAIKGWIRFIDSDPEHAFLRMWPIKMLMERCVKFLANLKMYV